MTSIEKVSPMGNLHPWPRFYLCDDGNEDEDEDGFGGGDGEGKAILSPASLGPVAIPNLEFGSTREPMGGTVTHCLEVETHLYPQIQNLK